MTNKNKKTIDSSVSLGNQLFVAVMFDNGPLVESLIENGARVDLADGRGMTALMHAAKKPKASSVRALIKAGADPLLVDSVGRTAFEIAREAKSWRCALYLSGYTPATSQIYRDFDVEVHNERVSRTPKGTQMRMAGI